LLTALAALGHRLWATQRETLSPEKPWTGTVAAGQAQTLSLRDVSPSALYSVFVALERPFSLADNDSVRITIRDGATRLAETLLHPWDGDSYILARPTVAGPLTVAIRSYAGQSVSLNLRVCRWHGPPTGTVEYEPNDTWQRANPITLGSVVFGGCDDRLLYPARKDPRAQPARHLTHYGQSMSDRENNALSRGEDWFTFEVQGDRNRLVYFTLDTVDREVPMDVTVWTVKDGRPEPFVGGIDPTTDISPETPAIDPHEVQTRLANAFTVRVLPPGRYYLRVEGNHPAYQLRTFVYDVPRQPQPDDDDWALAAEARKAVRAGMDYLVGAGDSWHANTPRMGSVQNRLMGGHAETAQCVACHPTQFSLRGHHLAVENGYPVRQRPAVQFLIDRIHNNPRPFYGAEGQATWARMISAPANVMSRMGYLSLLHQKFIDRHGDRPGFFEGINGYLKLYYGGRDRIPANETNGNLPVVSVYEFLGHSDLVLGRDASKDTPALRDRLRQWNETDVQSGRKDSAKRPVMLDLCYQTVNFVETDRTRYRERIRKNCERILQLQRPDGRWSMLLDPKSEAVYFQTGHCLWVLAQAGYGIDHPQVRKGVLALLRARQPWGGWLDSSAYENFKTPFRETQFAVMALSRLFSDEEPTRPREQTRGWQAGFPAPPARLDLENEAALLGQLDQLWKRPAANVLPQIGKALKHPEPLVRKAAAEAAGRFVADELWSDVFARLGDPSKVVRHSAAWAVRQYLNRGKGKTDDLRAALADLRGTLKRGAIRVLTQHFSVLTRDDALGARLTECLSDPDPLVRLLAARGAWQWFWWTSNLKRREFIVEAVLDRLGKERHPDVLPAVREALYVVADENTRYLYNNWVPLLGRQEDRDRATAAQHAQMKMIGERVARALEAGDERQTKNILHALSEFHLRRGGYKNAGRYGRIGNDIETIQFYADSRERLEPILLRLMRHPSAAIREHAAVAAFTLRGAGSTELLVRWVELYADPAAEVRGVAAELQKAFPLPNGKQIEGQIRQPLRKLLASSFPEAQTAALASLSRFPGLHKDAEVRRSVAAALQSDIRGLKRSALEAVLRMPALANDEAAASVNRLLRSANPENRQLLFEIVRSNPPLADNLEVVSVLSEALAAPQDSVRREALALVQKYPAMVKNPAVRLALKSLCDDPNERTRQLAEQLYQGKSGKVRDVAKLLDYDYFVARVEPVFARKGPDGQACATCHQTHTIFRLSRPGPNGSFSEEQSQLHYRSALKVVDLANPERSLLLRKPLSDARDEGVLDQKTLSHGGGIRWADAEDPAYRVILEWINGAKGKKD
jgi:hypothetical protein